MEKNKYSFEISKYNEIAKIIYAILGKYTYFPHPILKTQCAAINKTPENISKDDIAQLAGRLSKAVEVFSNPLKAKKVGEEILALVDSTPNR